MKTDNFGRNLGIFVCFMICGTIGLGLLMVNELEKEKKSKSNQKEEWRKGHMCLKCNEFHVIKSELFDCETDICKKCGLKVVIKTVSIKTSFVTEVKNIETGDIILRKSK